jgi:hypothetical protein
MATDVFLYLVKPGDQTYSLQDVGRRIIRGVEAGQTIDSMKCLGMAVEAHGVNPPLAIKDGKGQEHPLSSVWWLQLEVVISTQTTPRREVGRVHINQKGMLPLGPGGAPLERGPGRFATRTWKR